jgi:hypothetical protein
MPKLNQPIEVERAPRELPELGPIDLGHEDIEVLNLLPCCKATHTGFVKSRHDYDDRFLVRLFVVGLFAMDRAEHEFVRRRRCWQNPDRAGC